MREHDIFLLLRCLSEHDFPLAIIGPNRPWAGSSRDVLVWLLGLVGEYSNLGAPADADLALGGPLQDRRI
jgi:hypothetical protein